MQNMGLGSIFESRLWRDLGTWEKDMLVTPYGSCFDIKNSFGNHFLAEIWNAGKNGSNLSFWVIFLVNCCRTQNERVQTRCILKGLSNGGLLFGFGQLLRKLKILDKWLVWLLEQL